MKPTTALWILAPLASACLGAALLGGDMGPMALTFGRARLWNAVPALVADVIFDELYRVSHPLRRPAETFRAYERLWKNAPTARVRVAAKKRTRRTS